MDPSLSKALLCLLEYLKVGALFLIIIRCGGIANSSFLFRCLRFQYLLNSPMDTSLLCIKAYMDPSLLPCIRPMDQFLMHMDPLLFVLRHL